MPTCSKCLCVEVCKFFPHNKTKHPCEHFKDRVKFSTPPCKLGDILWAIRASRTNVFVKSGRVSQMKYNSNMDLLITVRNIATGTLGKTIFLTQEAAEKALKEREADKHNGAV